MSEFVLGVLVGIGVTVGAFLLGLWLRPPAPPTLQHHDRVPPRAGGRRRV